MTVRRKRATPRRRTAPRWAIEDWAAANLILYGRANGCCEHCGRPLNGRAERHHRMRRRDGGDRLSNLLLLLPECHSWVTEHPTEAKANGWIVEVGIADPADVPVRLGLSGALWLLDDQGGRHVVA